MSTTRRWRHTGETPHYKNYLSKINDLAERNAFVLEPALVANKNG